MIFKSENKFLTVNGKFLRNKVKSLSFTVFGKFFPLDFYDPETIGFSGRNVFVFQSNKPNSVTVSYGDGVYANYRFYEESPGIWQFGWRGLTSNYGDRKITDPDFHAYTDGNYGDRTVTFEFADLEAITLNPILLTLIKTTPVEWNYTLINELLLQYTASVTSLGIISIDTQSIIIGPLVFQNRLLRIPDQWFEAKNMVKIDFQDAFIFSDNIATNLFKINQWKLLQNVSLYNCRLANVPVESINELKELKHLTLAANSLKAIPAFGGLKNLLSCDLSNNPTVVVDTIPDWNGLPNLTAILWRFDSPVRLDYSVIPQNWEGLLSINYIDAYWRDNEHLDVFIEYFYELVTMNASIVAGGSEMPYPNRFRNIAWGYGSLTFSGAKVAPADYVQGVSNGNPANQGQKAYILQNQYNHVITHA